MALRKTPSAGGKPDKLIRDALMIAVRRTTKDENGRKTTYLNRIATKVVAQAANGDSQAYKELFDRIDGRPVQAIAATDTAGNPVAFVMLNRAAKEGK